MSTAITEKPDIEWYRANPERYQILSNGTVRDKVTRQICASFPELNPHAITPARSQELHRARKAQKARSALLGLVDMAKKHGAQVGDIDSLTDDELIAAGGDGVRLLTAHMAEQFMDSKNVRGLAESYSKLVDALSADDKPGTPPPGAMPAGIVGASVDTLLELVQKIEQEKRLRQDTERAVNIDAERWALEQQTGS